MSALRLTALFFWISVFSLTITVNAANVRINKIFNSDWDGVQIESVTPKFPDPDIEWQPVELPLFKGGHSLILRRYINVPKQWQSKQIVVTGRFCNYHTQILVNGKKAGDHRGGFGIFNINLTRFIQFGEKNELMLCINGPVLNTEKKSPDSLSYGQSWIWGVLGSIELNVFNSDHIDEIFIKPRLRKKRIEVSLTTKLDKTSISEYQLHFYVLDNTNQVRKQEILTCKSGEALYSLPWDLPKQWSPETPYLYNMKVELLKNSTLKDTLTTKFGYREFYAKNSFFYLNGKRINLAGDSWHFRHWPEEKIIRLFKILKAAGINTYRGHGPHPELWYRIADEMGMLMIAEGPTHQLYRDDVDHPDYRKNSNQTYTEWVKMIRNHPSIIIYSADNEVINGYGRGFQEDMPTDRNRQKMTENLLRLANIIRQHDDTRPIMHEGDGALDGYADIVNMHYPHEAPFWHLFPQDTLWLKNNPNACVWKYRPWNRKKPLYIGEFGKSYDISPRSVAFMAGDTAYYNIKAYYQAYGKIMRQMILGLRLSDCPGIAPWNTSTYGIIWPTNGTPLVNGLYDGIKSGFKRETLFNLSYNNRFYAGRVISRKLALFNDSLKDNSYIIKWELKDQSGGIIASEDREIILPAGNHKVFTITLENSTLFAGSEYNFFIHLLKENEELHKIEQKILVYHDKPLSYTSRKILLYDPDNVCKKALTAAKLKYRKINSIPAKAVSGKVLVVAPDALTDSIIDRLNSFAAMGGHLIVLSQTKWPDKWLGLRLPQKPMACTLAFARQPEHQALTSLRESATKYWAKNNIVSRNLFYKPVSGIMRIIIDSAGNQMGLKYAALVQGNVGHGLITCSQLDILPNLNSEPAAAVILKNLINQYSPPKILNKATLISQDNQLTQLFKDSAIHLNIAESFSDVLLTNNTIIIDGNLLATMRQQTIIDLKDAVQKGSTLFITEMSLNCTGNASKLIDSKVELIQHDYFQLALLQPKSFPGLSNDDLCWVVYDEWGCEYRHGYNKRWPIVDNTLRISPVTGGCVLMQTKPVLLGNMYGDSMWMKLTNEKFSFNKNNYSAMVEISKGKGKIIFCQIKLSAGYGEDKALKSDGKMQWNNYDYSIDHIRRRIAMGIAGYLNLH